MIRMNTLKHVDTHMGELISDLQKLIQQPSVSAKNEGIEECAKLVKTLLKFLYRKKEKNYVNNEIIINQNTEPKDKNINLIQEDLPFVKISTENKKKFILPSIDLLRLPSKKEREISSNNNEINADFLEKILLDFGVEGKIKKVSRGPVVTLNEFEPAAGIKVSKIINLSEDIARNTSSESARISTIPGRNTIGIELPNSSRENVYLSEILSHDDFSKKKY